MAADPVNRTRDSLQVLLAEDDPATALVYARALHRQGHRVVHVEDGVDALAALERTPYDAIVADWMMPRMDGLELVGRVRADFAQPPALMVITAKDAPDARMQALDAGADHFAAKPITPRDLVEQLGLCVIRREEIRGAEQRQHALAAARAAGVSAMPPDPRRDALYKEFQPLVRGLIKRYGGDTEARKDLEGEIYVIFASLLDAYDPKRGIPLRPYLVRNLTTSVYTLARSQWRRQKREVSLDWESRADLSDGADPSEEWDQSLLTDQVLAILPQLISHLPPRQRTVVISRYYEGKSYEEIAETLQVQPATVRSLLRHGMNALRSHVSQAGLGEASTPASRNGKLVTPNSSLRLH